jgi:hypothetical protein
LGGSAPVGKPVAIGSVELAFMAGIDETAKQSCLQKRGEDRDGAQN